MGAASVNKSPEADRSNFRLYNPVFTEGKLQPLRVSQRENDRHCRVGNTEVSEDVSISEYLFCSLEARIKQGGSGLVEVEWGSSGFGLVLSSNT